MDWQACKNKKLVKKVKLDTEMIASLIQSSKNKLKSESQLPLTPTTSSSKISLAYDSLRELLEALSLKNNYKIYNHECYTCFLKEILNKPSEASVFDKLRKTRNQINYYGKQISPQEASGIVNEIKKLIISIKDLLEKS